MKRAFNVGMNNFRMVSKSKFTTNIEHFVCQETKTIAFYTGQYFFVPAREVEGSVFKQSARAESRAFVYVKALWTMILRDEHILKPSL